MPKPLEIKPGDKVEIISKGIKIEVEIISAHNWKDAKGDDWYLEYEITSPNFAGEHGNWKQQYDTGTVRKL
jgi:hypothetical protein